MCRNGNSRWRPYFHDAFKDQYARAREAQWDWIADEAIKTADDSSGDYFVEDRNGESVVVPDHARVHRDRLRVDTRKWLLSKLAPKKYGDKVELLTAATDGQASGGFTISWAARPDNLPEPPAKAEPPRQLIFNPKPRSDDDVSPEVWWLVTAIAEVFERIVPADATPEEVRDIAVPAVEAAPRAHYAFTCALGY